ncbi:glutathione S-transferase T3-like [Chenopodium quinoa]|uniref:glutathione S-transferase T3-like n=1 Tax=Chenopodium quinoa TaxID=63459 RepID=UPI000B76F3D7|nr:glutathione S-transferase T3-like [Chenopodium quinoa]
MNQSPGGVCSSNATPIELSGEHVEELAGAQHLEEIDNAEVEIVPEVQLNTSAQRKNQAWSIAEDKALVSAYINAGGDVERGTKTKRSGLWAEIHNQYEKARAENLNEIKVRHVKSLQNRWDHINEHVSKWVDAYGYHFRTKGSGESEQNLERFAHIDYKATNNKMFCYLHCFAIMRKYPKWDPSLSKVQSDMLPGGQASTDSGGSGKRSQPDSQCEVGGRAKRPLGIKQTKMKGKASSTSSSVNLDSLNTNFNDMGEKLGQLGERLLDQMRERDEEQKARVEEKKRQKEEAMKFRMLERLMQNSVLDDKELAMYNKLRDEFSSRFSL